MIINNGFLIQWLLLVGAPRNQNIYYPCALKSKCVYINGHPIYSDITGYHDYDPNFLTEDISYFIIYCDPNGNINANKVNIFCIGY